MVGARVGEMLKFQATITAQRQFDGGVNGIVIALEAAMPAADETLGIRRQIQPAAQVADFEIGFAKRDRPP